MKTANPDAVFLNVPYDDDFLDLYLAYIVGLVELGLTPRAALELPHDDARLDAIMDLIRSCHYSIHDLSRVELDEDPPPTPRFNMPFELGLALAWQRLAKIFNPALVHSLRCFESRDRRAEKSISDMRSIDFFIHEGKHEGIMRELCNAFVRTDQNPEVPVMMAHFDALRKAIPNIREKIGAPATRAGGLFQSRAFKELVTLATQIRNTDPLTDPRKRRPGHGSPRRGRKVTSTARNR